MSTDTQWRFGDVPKRYHDAVQRAAVLHPLMHKVCYTPADIVEATICLCGVWRARIRNLTAHGWLPRPSRYSIIYTRNCPPTFVMTEPVTRVCGQRMLCPFCYARWVRDVWLRVDAACRFERERRTGGRRLILGEERVRNPFRFHIVERRHKYWVPYVEPAEGVALLNTILAFIPKKRAGIIDVVKPLGAFITSTVEPYARGWLVRHRQLFKLAAEQPFPEELAKVKGSYVRHERPSRKVLLGAVTRTCRYPLQLMFGPPDKVTELLQARASSSARLTSFFGDFRGHSPRQQRGSDGRIDE